MADERVVVTGGSGNLGGFAVRALVEAGYDVLNLDVAPPKEKICPSWICDLTRAGDAYEAFEGAAAVVHLAALQAPGLAPDTETFRINITSSYNVLKAAVGMGIGRVVMASSIAAYGFTYAPRMWAPDYLPLDEDHPCRPRDPYGLSKIFAEQLADAFVAQSDLSVVSLRLAGVNFDLGYRSLPERWADPSARIGTFWSYVDARDAAVACRLAVAADVSGHRVFNIAADTSRYPEPTAGLVEKYLPGTRIRDGFDGHWGGLDATRAKTVLGFRAEHLWQNYLTSDGKPVPRD